MRNAILTYFSLHNSTYIGEINQRKKKMKRKNITKLSLYIYCVKKVCQNIISEKIIM
jgi:hypothetical protein